MIDVKDRVSTKEGRYLVEHEDGSTEYATLVRADEPTEPGTPLNKTLFDSIKSDIDGKQNTLTAGTNITIENNVISSSGESYTAGDNISISDENVISADLSSKQNIITKDTDLELKSTKYYGNIDVNGKNVNNVYVLNSTEDKSLYIQSELSIEMTTDNNNSIKLDTGTVETTGDLKVGGVIDGNTQVNGDLILNNGSYKFADDNTMVIESNKISIVGADDDKLELKRTGITFDAHGTSNRKISGDVDIEANGDVKSTVSGTTHTLSNKQDKLTPGDNITIIDNVISATGGSQYTLPPATTTTLGGIKVGDNLDVASDGTLSVAEDLSINSIGNENGFDITGEMYLNNDIDMQSNSLYNIDSLRGKDGSPLYIGDGNTKVDISAPIDLNNNKITNLATPTDNTDAATKGYVDGKSYTLPTASASTLGGVKVGSGLAIDGNGILSASGGGAVQLVRMWLTPSSGGRHIVSLPENVKNFSVLASAVYDDNDGYWHDASCVAFPKVAYEDGSSNVYNSLGGLHNGYHTINIDGADNGNSLALRVYVDDEECNTLLVIYGIR